MKLLGQGLSAAPSMRRDLSWKMKMKRQQRHGHEKGGFQMKNLESDAFVFFGATGDLAYEQIFPALQAMTRRGQFEIPIIGVGRSAKDLEALRARAHRTPRGPRRECAARSPPAWRPCFPVWFPDCPPARSRLHSTVVE